LHRKYINPANKVSSNIFNFLFKKKGRKEKENINNLLFYKSGITTHFYNNKVKDDL